MRASSLFGRALLRSARGARAGGGAAATCAVAVGAAELSARCDAAAVALRAYTAAEWRCERGVRLPNGAAVCDCLMALRCATPLSARRPAAGVCGGRVALQGVRRPNGAAGVCGGRMALQGVPVTHACVW